MHSGHHGPAGGRKNVMQALQEKVIVHAALSTLCLQELKPTWVFKTRNTYLLAYLLVCMYLPICAYHLTF
jgi:hypothetical protein